MAQYEIYNFLKKNRGGIYTSKELSEIMGVNCTSITQNLSRLLKRNLIKRKKDVKDVYYYMEEE